MLQVPHKMVTDLRSSQLIIMILVIAAEALELKA